MVFLADTSSTVTQDEFKTEKDFVKAISKLLNVSPGKSRASFVTYSNFPRVIVKLNGYKDRVDFEKQINSAPLTGGSRRMDKALEEAGNILREGRKNVPKIVVLMTTGRQTPERDAQSLDKKAAILDSIGAKTYVIAIGKRPDTRELSLAVKKSEDIVRIYSIRDVLSQTGPTAQKIIKNSRKYEK